MISDQEHTVGEVCGVHVAICQPFFSRFSGSEVLTLELAEALAESGARVTVVTWLFSDLLKAELNPLPGVRIAQVNSQEYFDFVDEAHIDLVWANQGFVPKELIESASKYVFAHLSSFNSFEFPFSPALERALADRVYFVSPEAEHEHLATGAYEGFDADRFRLLENPAPREFHQVEPRSSDEGGPRLTSLLVVSNHLPDEIVEAIGQLGDMGVHVHVVGSPRDGVDAHQERVTAELVAEFDAVLTIGKTVQYALCAGRPVFCYDYFGGPGWIIDFNFASARWFNFSGRGFDQRSAPELRQEILEGFTRAHQFVRTNLGQFRSDFSADRLLLDLVDVLSEPNGRSERVPSEIRFGYEMAHKTVADFGVAYHLDQMRTRLTNDHIKNLEAMLRDLRLEIGVGKAENARLKDERALLVNSISWKITRPIRALRRAFRAVWR